MYLQVTTLVDYITLAFELSIIIQRVRSTEVYIVTLLEVQLIYLGALVEHCKITLTGNSQILPPDEEVLTIQVILTSEEIYILERDDKDVSKVVWLVRNLQQRVCLYLHYDELIRTILKNLRPSIDDDAIHRKVRQNLTYVTSNQDEVAVIYNRN